MTSPAHKTAALLVALRLAALAAQKSVNEVVRGYDDALTRFAFDVLGGRMGPVDFRRAHKELLRAVALEAYSEGLREGGVDEPPDDDDRATVRGWLDEQVGHVNDFAAWLASEPRNSEAKRRELADRVALWVEALEQLGNLGRASAKDNLMVEFVGDDGDESCDECREYKGQRHRVKWWVSRGLVPGKIGNENFSCGGYRCKHFLADKDGNRVLP